MSLSSNSDELFGKTLTVYPTRHHPTTMSNPITPPPELVASLRNSAPHGIQDAGVTRELWLINHAYQAGADQELEACVNYIDNNMSGNKARELRAARRPKPPSLKEQALVVLMNSAICDHLSPQDEAILCRALNELSDN